jgi:hypothetical protein
LAVTDEAAAAAERERASSANYSDTIFNAPEILPDEEQLDELEAAKQTLLPPSPLKAEAEAEAIGSSSAQVEVPTTSIQQD